MGRYGKMDYPRMTKLGFLFGLGLLAIGAIGSLIGHGFFEPLPAWESALLFDLEVIGLVIGFFSPLIFGIFMPLTE